MDLFTESSLLLLVCVFALYVFRGGGALYVFAAFFVFGLYVENSPESHKPVEISYLRLLTSQEVRGIPRVPPGALRPLTGR